MQLCRRHSAGTSRTGWLPFVTERYRALSLTLGRVWANASHIALVEAVNLLLLSILEDDPRAIGTVTLSGNEFFMTIVVGDPKSLHQYSLS